MHMPIGVTCLKVFERPGPVNTDETISILQNAQMDLRYLVVASVSGDSAVKAAERVKNRKVVCVTTPQGMFWEVNALNAELFNEVPRTSRATGGVGEKEP